MSSVVAQRPRSVPAAPAAATPRRPSPDTLLATGLGALLAAVALGAGGGQQLGSATTIEVLLELVGGLTATAALLVAPGRRAHGAPALACFGLVLAVTGASILWSVQPDDTWQETNRLLSYLAAFGIGVALVRIAPGRWAAVLHATIVASALVTAYALATKVFPGSLNPGETYARLREPFGYWNAVGLMAALGGPGCLWLGSRRSGHAAVNAAAYPILTGLLVAILLAYSRGALLALALGCAVWFAFVPLRLRGAALLATAALGALVVVSWTFARDALSKDGASLASRSTAGHELGLLLVLVLGITVAIGLAVGFATAQRAPGASTRRRAGVAILVVLALVPVGLAVALSFSERGLGGSISNGWRTLTDPDASTPSNTPGRLSAVGSVRARYFRDALDVFEDRPLQGSGAGTFATVRPRFRHDGIDVRHAHSYLFQTASDLGSLGLLANLALFVAWGAAALRATALLRRRRERRRLADAEVIGLRTLLAVVVVFGVHSLVDWTWYVPGTAVVALVCAGFLAGRGPTGGPARDLRGLRDGVRDRAALGLGALLVLATLVGAWATIQPLRGVHAGDAALERLTSGNAAGALAAAHHAHAIDPLAVDPIADEAVIAATTGDVPAARAALRHAVALQPQNPATWLRLAQFEDGQDDRSATLAALGPALYLDPMSTAAVTLFLDVNLKAAADKAAATAQHAADRRATEHRAALRRSAERRRRRSHR